MEYIIHHDMETGNKAIWLYALGGWGLRNEELLQKQKFEDHTKGMSPVAVWYEKIPVPTFVDNSV